MADDTLSKLLQTAIEQYDRAVRWSSVLLVALAAFHLTTFERFVETSREMTRSKEQQRQLADLSASTKRTSDDLKQLLATVEQSMRQRINSEFDGLRSSFAQLNLEVAEVWCRKHLTELAAHSTRVAAYSACVGPAAQRVSAGKPQPQLNMSMMSQMALPVQRGDGTGQLQTQSDLRRSDPEQWLQMQFEPQLLPKELALQVSGLPNRDDQLVGLLAPFIESTLITPVFDHINQAWRDGQLPKLLAFAERSAQPRDPAVILDETLTAAAEKSAEATGRFRSAAEKVQFRPPDKERWWLTVGGKGEASDKMMQMVDSVANRGSSEALASLTAVLARLGEAETAKANVLKSLELTMKQLNDGFEAQRKQLGDLVEPLKAVAIDLAFFCRHFALIIALASAAAIVWPGEKLRIARLTARMAEAAGLEPTLWRWFEARRGMPAATWISDARPVILGAALIVWTLYTAYRLTALPDAVPSVWYEATFGTAILLGAMAWRWSVLRQA